MKLQHTPTCQHCSTKMQQKKIVQKDYGQQALGLILALVGFTLLFIVPIGTLIGMMLLIAGASMGYKKGKGWECSCCGYSFIPK